MCLRRNLSAEELTKDATRSVRTDSKESGANKPTTGGGDTPGTPTSAAGKPLHSALKKGGKSNKVRVPAEGALIHAHMLHGHRAAYCRPLHTYTRPHAAWS